MESKVKNENFYVVQGWMINELKLKGTALALYAIIYGFSQSEQGKFTGSLQYLADWTHSTKQGVLKALKTLQEKGFVEKKSYSENGLNFVTYRSTKFNGVLNKVEQGYSTKFNGGIKQSLPNNIDNNNITDNIDNISRENSSNSRFIPPTVEEVEQYCQERKNNIDAEEFVAFYDSKNWMIGKTKMSKWKSAIITWEKQQRKEQKSNQPKLAPNETARKTDPWAI